MRTVILQPKGWMAGEKQNSRETWEGRLEVDNQCGVSLTVIGPNPRGPESYKHIVSLSRTEAIELIIALRATLDGD